MLLGAGHSHVEVLRRFGTRPHPGVRLTLVTPVMHTPYSGMIPGYVSGFYSLEECHIDLCRLARFANARVVLSSAIGIDSKSQTVQLASSGRTRPPLQYDVLSINVGITPDSRGLPGVEEHTVPVKPISTFAAKLEKILQGFEAFVRQGDISSPYQVLVVGGGAGGVELACALQYRLSSIAKAQSMKSCFAVSLVSKGSIMSSSHPFVRKRLLRILDERNITLVESNSGVYKVEKGRLYTDEKEIVFDDCVWCTKAKAPEWFRNTDLAIDEDGYILVDEYLSVVDSQGCVFGAGDCVTLSKSPRPKAGVYAVRAGPVLADNIERALKNQTLRSWHPQSSNLSLIACGDRYAVMSKQWFSYDAGFLWSWKDSIDTKFMAMYGSDLERMKVSSNMMSEVNIPDPIASLQQMRCGGCGSKIGSTILTSVLEALRERQGEELTNVAWGDDAAIIPNPPDGYSIIQTIDYFKCPMVLQDPYTFGYISAIHAMSDCYAMNGTPTSALALAVLPLAIPDKVRDQLYHLMCGAYDALAEAGCNLVGGHTSEGTDFSMGLSITGQVKKDATWTKGGMAPGHDIILTKPIGTGILLAAAEEGIPVGPYFASIVHSMCQSNLEARNVLQTHTVTACTDVTGFGLLGHLLEMCIASNHQVEISLDALPIFPGVQECIDRGVSSSLTPENERMIYNEVMGAQTAKDARIWKALVDPQTSGGLLCTMPPEETEECLEKLVKAGFPHATRIGRVFPFEGNSRILLNNT